MLRSNFVPRSFLALRTVEQQPHGSGFPVLPTRRSLWRATSAVLLVRMPAPEAQASRVADGRFQRLYSYPVARDGDTLNALVRSAQRNRHGVHADHVVGRITVQVLSADSFFRRTGDLLRCYPDYRTSVLVCQSRFMHHKELPAAGGVSSPAMNGGAFTPQIW